MTGRRLVHKQVGTPGVVHAARVVLEEEHVVWFARCGAQDHVGFFRRAAAFAVVALDAGADQVLPLICTAP